MIKINFKQLHENAVLPSQNFPTDAGYDIYSVEDKTIQPGKSTTVSTGIALQMEWDFKPFDVDSLSNLMPTIMQNDFLNFANNFTFLYQEYLKQTFKFLFKIESRSGMAAKKGIHCIGGIVDQEFIGEIRVILANTSKASYHIEIGDRVAQGIPTLIPKVFSTQWVNELEPTVRNDGGLGSSGK